MKKLSSSHPHLNGSFASTAALMTATSIATDYQGKIAVVLEGPMSTDKELTARRSEIDGLAIGAAIDAKKIDSLDEKSALYAVFRSGYMKAYKGGEIQALRHGLDERQPLVSLRQALGIDEKGAFTDPGQIGKLVAMTYNKVAEGLRVAVK
jgi:hypothetical protein